MLLTSQPLASYLQAAGPGITWLIQTLLGGVTRKRLCGIKDHPYHTAAAMANKRGHPFEEISS